MDKIQEQVWHVIQEMNRKWTVENKSDELKNYFHKNMVAIVPTNTAIIDGGADCVAGWKGFAENATIHHWEEINPHVHIYGDGKFAIVAYDFAMSFDMHGRTIRMRGRDLFALVCEDGKWWIVSDQFSQTP